MLLDFETGKLRRVIATGSWGTGIDCVNLDVMVNVSGMRSSIDAIQWAGRNSRIHDGKKFGIIIDSRDRWDKWAYGRASERLRLYAKKGWDILRLDDYEGFGSGKKSK